MVEEVRGQHPVVSGQMRSAADAGGNVECVSEHAAVLSPGTFYCEVSLWTVRR